MEDVRLHLRLLRDQSMGLERMEAELLELFREWHRQPRKDPPRGDFPTPRS
jgi:hypothetical protein